MRRADFSLVPTKALTLLNWNHSKYGGGNMPSISDFPPAGNMPSGNTWKTEKKNVQEQNKEGNQLDQIIESAQNHLKLLKYGRVPFADLLLQKTPACTEAMQAQHLGSLVLLHELNSPKHSVRFDKNKKLENLRRPGGHVVLVAGTYHLPGYHSKDPCQLSPNNRKGRDCISLSTRSILNSPHHALNQQYKQQFGINLH